MYTLVRFESTDLNNNADAAEAMMVVRARVIIVHMARRKNYLCVHVKVQL